MLMKCYLSNLKDIQLVEKMTSEDKQNLIKSVPEITKLNFQKNRDEQLQKIDTFLKSSDLDNSLLFDLMSFKNNISVATLKRKHVQTDLFENNEKHSAKKRKIQSSNTPYQIESEMFPKMQSKQFSENDKIIIQQFMKGIKESKNMSVNEISKQVAAHYVKKESYIKSLFSYKKIPNIDNYQEISKLFPKYNAPFSDADKSQILSTCDSIIKNHKISQTSAFKIAGNFYNIAISTIHSWKSHFKKCQIQISYFIHPSE